MSAPRIYLSPPDVGPLEEEAVLTAIRTGWVAPAGPDLDAFEQAVADRTGRAHAVGLSSGTSALHLALVHWGVGPGDVVPVSTLTFAATVNAIAYTGAMPYLIDSDPESGNINVDLLAEALDTLAAEGARVPVVVAVDLFGKCADYARLTDVVAPRGIRLLADAAEALGARYAGRPAGSFGDAAVVSFNGNKIITTSSGGMLVTDDPAMAAHVRKLSTQAREPVAHYEHREIGYNYRLSNILAALGRAQLARLDSMVERRRQWRTRYRALFAAVDGVRVLGGHDDTEDNCWLTPIVVDETASWTAADLAEALWADGIESRPIWKPMHSQPVFAHLPSALDGTADRLFAQGLALPSGSAMTDDDFANVESVMRAFLEER